MTGTNRHKGPADYQQDGDYCRHFLKGPFTEGPGKILKPVHHVTLADYRLILRTCAN